ncbi:MAG: sulfatase-like hydrolase/transferase [Bryobacterales bacterium]|nr:sulfatase-like hydrolase/transferase [Bryobacterales bacterium]
MGDFSRRQWIGLAAAASAAQAAEGVTRPNIVVVMTDDQGSHDLGCYGARDLRTPEIDALAAAGARFTNWYSNAPVCAPARAALMTGRYPARAGVVNNGQRLEPRQKTTATLLKQGAGYRTALIGKWHLGDTPDTLPNAHGFDYFYGFLPGCVDFYSHRFYWGERGAGQVNFHSLYRDRQEIFEDGEYLTTRITEEACAFIRRSAGEPFFLTVTYNAPHYPMHAPQRYVDRFPHIADPERRVYAAMIAAVDDGVGELRRTLRQAGQLENTLFIFLADNGATTEARAGLDQKPATAGSNEPYRGYKFSLFDGGMHVPAIMSWPGKIASGTVVAKVAMTMDVLPTACAAAGVAIPAGHAVDGRNLLPLDAPSAHAAIFWENGKQRGVRKGNWKLVLDGHAYGRTPADNKPLAGEDAVFLSDLSKDPSETTNLRRAHPQVVDELTTAIQAWYSNVRN